MDSRGRKLSPGELGHRDGRWYMLLNLMERLRIYLLKKVVIGKKYQLDLESGLETLIYPGDSAPYYVGEMISTWEMPPVEREVMKWL